MSTRSSRRLLRGLKSSSSLSTMKDMGTFRVAFLGPARVGKSSIIRQFLYELYDNKYTKTIEELHRAEYFCDGLKLTLDILDTAGAYDFPAMRSLAIARSDAFVLVYSVDDKDSFCEVSSLLQTIWQERGVNAVPIVVVGNKADVTSKKRTVFKATAEGIACVDWNCSHVEVSAKDNENLVMIFQEMLRQANIQFNIVPAVSKRRQSLPAMRSNEERRDSKTKEKKSLLRSLFSLPRSKSI